MSDETEELRMREAIRADGLEARAMGHPDSVPSEAAPALSPTDAAVVERVVDTIASNDAQAHLEEWPPYTHDGTNVINEPLRQVYLHDAHESIADLVALVVAARAETAKWMGHADNSDHEGLAWMERANMAESRLAARTRERDALVKYAEHLPACVSRTPPFVQRSDLTIDQWRGSAFVPVQQERDARCTCGLAALRAAGGEGGK